MTQELNELIQKYIDDFNAKKGWAVNHSLPIVWFGDMERYLQSERKILTISSHPSPNEFEGHISAAVDLNGTNGNRVQELAGILNGYFKSKPNKSWFEHFEKRLNLKAINASYYEKDGMNAALHINIHSAIAPKQKSEAAKKMIRNTALSKQLVELLNPDLILYSASESTRQEIFSAYLPVAFESYIGKYAAKNGKILVSAPCLSYPFICMTDAEIEIALAKLL